MDSREGEGGRGLRIFEELEAGMRTKGKGLANELKDPTLVAWEIIEHSHAYLHFTYWKERKKKEINV